MSFKKLLAATAVVGAATTMSTPAHAGADPLLGEIMLVGYNFCPRGWQNADGQLLAINSNTALFSLYGTMYGGDGRTTFALPDLKGRTPIHVGSGAGLPPTTSQGAKGGTTQFTILNSNVPSHTHTGGLETINAAPSTSSAVGNAIARTAGANIYAPGEPKGGFLHSGTVRISSTSSPNLAINKRSPYQVLRYCVAMQGVYPSRN